ncbi:MAG: hypothetical protein GTO14_14330 [Anaerolineales bacterium]|nr:hypothetical protein [Anaerolineales bacterium]
MTGYFSRLLRHAGVDTNSRVASRPAAVPPIEVHEQRLVEPTSISEVPRDSTDTATQEVRDAEVHDTSQRPSKQAVEISPVVTNDNRQADTQHSAPPAVEQRVELHSSIEQMSLVDEPQVEKPEVLSDARQPVTQSLEIQVPQEVEQDEMIPPSKRPAVRDASPEVADQLAMPILEQEILRVLPSEGVPRRPTELHERRRESPEEAEVRRTQVWRQVYEGVRQWVASSPEQGEAEIVVADERVTVGRTRPVTQKQSSERPVLVTENQELQLSIGSIHVSLDASAEERRPIDEQRETANVQRRSTRGRSRMSRHYLRMR